MRRDPWALAWSPDSKEIAFGGNGQVHRVRVNARRPSRVPSDGFIGSTVTTDIAWSPDGSTIVYVRGVLTDTGPIDSRDLSIFDLKTQIDRPRRAVIDSFCVVDSGSTITWLQERPLRLAVFAGTRTDLLSGNGRKLGSLRPPNRGFLSVQRQQSPLLAVELSGSLTPEPTASRASTPVPTR